MNIALGQWIATLANRQALATGEDVVQALTGALEWVDTQQGAYRALGSPYGHDDADLLRWLEERNPLPPERVPGAVAQESAAQRTETGDG